MLSLSVITTVTGLFFYWLTDTNAFLPRTKTSLRRQQQQHGTRRQVFERMSDDCIAAIMEAQEQAAKLQLPQVGCECVVVGCISHAKNKTPLQRTLLQYRINNYRLAEKTLHNMYRSDKDDQGWLSGFRARQNDEDRPFDVPLKKALREAAVLANQMGEIQVQTHHVFLALLEYKEDQEGKASAAVVRDDICTCGGWALLAKMDCMEDSVTALDVCQSLLQHLQASASTESSSSKELVTSGAGTGSSGKTPTLQEVGVDLTQLAADGLLDSVYGRETELRACVRTLLRRRKNNVVLLGEAGVGKTAIAEGLAHILVEEGKCPERLQSHRLISLELGSLVAGTKYRGTTILYLVCF